MAIQSNPNDPFETGPTNHDVLRRRTAKRDSALQADPELAEGPAGGGRMALFAIAIVAILGVVLYGLNNSSVAPTPNAQTTLPAPTTDTAATPRPAGQTTGSAFTPSQPATPPAATYGDNAKGDNSGATQLSPSPSPADRGTTPLAPSSNN